MVDIERSMAVDVGLSLTETTERLSPHLEGDTAAHLASNVSEQRLKAE
jgi:hypothetical protein